VFQRSLSKGKRLHTIRGGLVRSSDLCNLYAEQGVPKSVAFRGIVSGRMGPRRSLSAFQSSYRSGADWSERSERALKWDSAGPSETTTHFLLLTCNNSTPHGNESQQPALMSYHSKWAAFRYALCCHIL